MWIGMQLLSDFCYFLVIFFKCQIESLLRRHENIFGVLPRGRWLFSVGLLFGGSFMFLTDLTTIVGQAYQIKRHDSFLVRHLTFGTVVDWLVALTNGFFFLAALVMFQEWFWKLGEYRRRFSFPAALQGGGHDIESPTQNNQ